MKNFEILFEAFCGLTPLETAVLELDTNKDGRISNPIIPEEELISVFLTFNDKQEKYLPLS